MKWKAYLTTNGLEKFGLMEKPLDWADANIHILNHGLHYASCVFEGERVYDGEIFKLEQHTERLFHSANRMGIKVPYSQQKLMKLVKV